MIVAVNLLAESGWKNYKISIFWNSGPDPQAEQPKIDLFAIFID
jgi:hypothetical protein